jgi:hypothetical protein
MLRFNIAQLPLHEQKLYRLIAVAASGAFIIGLLWVLLGFSDQAPTDDNEWQLTTIGESGDPLTQFSALSEQSRWFIESSKRTKAKPQEDPLKTLEGKPESLRLTGLITTGDKTYALFLPLMAPAGTTAKPAIRQLAEGDVLVGDWVVERISSNQVEIQQGDETRTLKMYQSKVK